MKTWTIIIALATFCLAVTADAAEKRKNKQEKLNPNLNYACMKPNGQYIDGLTRRDCRLLHGRWLPE